jgi:hypothetical protein
MSFEVWPKCSAIGLGPPGVLARQLSTHSDAAFVTAQRCRPILGMR